MCVLEHKGLSKPALLNPTREVQIQHRASCIKSSMEPAGVRRFYALAGARQPLIWMAMLQLQLSACVYYRVLKLARMIIVRVRRKVSGVVVG
jgi:hypothetical protein